MDDFIIANEYIFINIHVKHLKVSPKHIGVSVNVISYIMKKLFLIVDFSDGLI